MKENGFTLKSRCKRNPTEAINDANYAVCLANTLVQAKSPQSIFEQQEALLYLNSDKTRFMCFKQDGIISSLNR